MMVRSLSRQLPLTLPLAVTCRSLAVSMRRVQVRFLVLSLFIVVGSSTLGFYCYMSSRFDGTSEVELTQAEGSRLPYVYQPSHEHMDIDAEEGSDTSSVEDTRLSKADWEQFSANEVKPAPSDNGDAFARNVNLPSAPFESGQYTAFGTGWPAMARIIREVDEQKIQNYEKDIDGILIFAGLFSAAMTAFLVESYRNLSQDPTQVMILLMQQLALQTHSYSINAGFLNSTVPPLMPVIAPFQPTANAIRVNALWFASLTLTLVSASFSILVKQWLREFLAGEYTSPQARIRVRHFRSPGLDDWKVFEIAGVLPLLLQLSLALFLIGLCFFTAEVHSSLGYTTLPLVAAWAFLIVAVSCAPALSPRCPYKTALLKSTMKVVRRFLLEVVSSVTNNTGNHDVSHALTRTLGRWRRLLSWDEEEVARSNANDIDILIAVDTIQSDDRLFDIMLNIILESMEHSQPGAAGGFTESLFKLLKHRCKQDTDKADSPFLHLAHLPRPTVTTVMTMVASMLRKEVERQSILDDHTAIEWAPWMEDCVYILFSDTGSPGPATSVAVDELFSLLLADLGRAEGLFKVITSRAPDPDVFFHVLARLRPAMKLADRDNLLANLTSLTKTYFCSEASHVHHTLIDVVKDHSEIPPQHVNTVNRLVISLVKTEVTTAKGFETWTFDAQRYLLQIYSRLSTTDLGHAEILEFVRFLLTSEANCNFVYIPMMTMYDSATYRVEEDIARQVFIDAAVTSTPDDLRKILDNLASYAPLHAKKEVYGEPESDPDRLARLDPLRACLMLLRLLRALREQGVSLEEYASPIREFWRVTKAGLRTVAGIRDLWKEDYLASARQCLELINELNTYRLPQEHDDFSLDNSRLIPNSVAEDIALYTSQPELPLNYRLRRSPLLPTETFPATQLTNTDRRSRNDSSISYPSSHPSHSSRCSYPETASLPYQQSTPTRDHTVAKALTM